MSVQPRPLARLLWSLTTPMIQGEGVSPSA